MIESAIDPGAREKAIDAATEAVIKAVFGIEMPHEDREEWKKVARYTIAAYGESLTAAGYVVIHKFAKRSPQEMKEALIAAARKIEGKIK
jgi:hypothetical protein